MKKILPIVIVGMLFFCGFGAAVITEGNPETETKINNDMETSSLSRISILSALTPPLLTLNVIFQL